MSLMRLLRSPTRNKARTEETKKKCTDATVLTFDTVFGVTPLTSDVSDYGAQVQIRDVDKPDLGTPDELIEIQHPVNAEPSISKLATSAFVWAGYSEDARQLAHELKFNPMFMSEGELAHHNGTHPDGLLLLALKSSAHEDAVILDVSEGGADYYAPGQAYHALTGRDCSRALSLTSLAPEHLHADMEGASESEWAVLDEWAAKLRGKYPTVGILKPSPASQDAPAGPVKAHPPEIEDEWRMVG